ncbi:MAG: hypothetical protein GY810_09995 [Aureispira sp.]|nr:hypothetical protein [Aureispira sp.]
MTPRIYLFSLLLLFSTTLAAQSNQPNWTIGVEVGTGYFQNIFEKKSDLNTQESAATDTILDQKKNAGPIPGLTVGLVTSKKLFGSMTFDFG